MGNKNAKKKVKAVGIKKLDTTWSKAVRARARNKCEYCGKTHALNAHHIFSRSKKSTRWDMDNGISLCAGCHVFSSTFSAHKTPTEFVEWIKKYRGLKWYNRLRKKANSVVKYQDNNEILEQLNGYIK